MDSFDELPDNFDEAYTLFSQLFANSTENSNTKTDAGTSLGSDKLLNDQEQQVFSKFLDNVLDDPKSAADSHEIKWLDQHFGLGDAARPPEVPRETRPLQGDFYRGFREMGRGYNQVMPGEHPQQAESFSRVPQYPMVGTFGAGGHIVPTIPGPSPAEAWYRHPPAKLPTNPHANSHGNSPAHPHAPPPHTTTHAYGQAQQHQAVAQSARPSPPSAPQIHQEPSGTEQRFSAAKALSSACVAYVRGHSPTPLPSPPEIHRYSAVEVADSQVKRARPSPPEEKPIVAAASTTAPTAAAQKKKREFLTENQVRLNHINSEKRRRDLISSNFKQMCGLVPSIKGVKTALPKAIVLQHVYEYLLEVAGENKAIRAQLTQMGIDPSDVPQNKLGEKLIETDGPELV